MKMTMQQKKGWAAFVLFGVTCIILGERMLMNRSLNMALLLILGVSVVVAYLMNGARPGPENEKSAQAELIHLDEGE